MKQPRPSLRKAMEIDARPTLYLVPAPLDAHYGLWEPETQVRQALRAAKWIFAENIRTVRRYMASLKLGKAIDDYHFEVFNKTHELKDAKALVRLWLIDGGQACLVSEAGCPGVADPGRWLVRACHLAGIDVVPLVGPSAILLSLMASGLSGQQFRFSGYFPIKPEERAKFTRQLVHTLEREDSTFIFIETPFRNQALFDYLLKSLPSTMCLSIGLQLNTPQQLIKTKTIAEWQQQPLQLPKEPCMFLIGG